jgi:hypothetical protein
VLVVGVIFSAIGFGSFFSAFGTFEPPRYFWCVFIGFPLIGVGAIMANEVAPVGKDVVNYMADGTKGAVRDMAAAVGEGLRGSPSDGRIRCHKCNTGNEASAKFCKSCGTPLNKACPSCGELNDADAQFCDGCGKAIA